MKLNFNKVLPYALALLALAALFGVFSGSNEPVIPMLQGSAIEPLLIGLHNGNSIVFNLSIGYLVSTFFWLLVVYLPERNSKKLIRDNLRRRYQNFREDTIQILLWVAIGTHDSDLPKQLCDPIKFREFFNENEKEHWYAALNGLQGNEDRIKDLLLEMEIFAGEVAYVLNKVSIQDPKVHSFFKRLNEQILRLKSASVYSYDQVKYLGSFLWEVNARWSFIDGYRENDIIEDMIAEL